MSLLESQTIMTPLLDYCHCVFILSPRRNKSLFFSGGQRVSSRSFRHRGVNRHRAYFGRQSDHDRHHLRLHLRLSLLRLLRSFRLSLWKHEVSSEENFHGQSRYERYHRCLICWNALWKWVAGRKQISVVRVQKHSTKKKEIKTIQQTDKRTNKQTNKQKMTDLTTNQTARCIEVCS